MEKIYLDNAATSFPKAPGLGSAMADYIDRLGVNINRGSYAGAQEVEDDVMDTRELLCRLFHFEKASHVIFTPGVTYSLNYLIKGLLRPGDHCIVSGFEHNAVMRPLCGLRDVSWSAASADLSDLSGLFRPETKLVIMTHASNVFGNVLPLEAVGKLCWDKGVPLVADAAQTAGNRQIDFSSFPPGALCFSGHKGLLGPQGIGGILLSPELARCLPPLIEGGTGSASDSMETPPYLPDKFEAGTLNLPGIVGLRHSLRFLAGETVEAVGEKEALLSNRFLEGVSDLPGVEVFSPGKDRVAVVSLRFRRLDNGEAADLLEREYGISVRCGLHCSPLAHQTMGTFPEGTVRFSFGYFNTVSEVDSAVRAVRKISGR